MTQLSLTIIKYSRLSYSASNLSYCSFLIISKVRIIGNMVKNNCCCEKNNGQNVQEYKNRIIGQKIIYQGLLGTKQPVYVYAYIKEVQQFVKNCRSKGI